VYRTESEQKAGVDRVHAVEALGGRTSPSRRRSTLTDMSPEIARGRRRGEGEAVEQEEGEELVVVARDAGTLAVIERVRAQGYRGRLKNSWIRRCRDCLCAEKAMLMETRDDYWNKKEAAGAGASDGAAETMEIEMAE
jgi:hypothetical protein